MINLILFLFLPYPLLLFLTCFLCERYLIKLRQKEYYYNLGIADKKSDSSVFVEFMLEIIKQSVEELVVQN